MGNSSLTIIDQSSTHHSPRLRCSFAHGHHSVSLPIRSRSPHRFCLFVHATQRLGMYIAIDGSAKVRKFIIIYHQYHPSLTIIHHHFSTWVHRNRVTRQRYDQVSGQPWPACCQRKAIHWLCLHRYVHLHKYVNQPTNGQIAS